ncbi:hypothetical protein SM438_20995 [Salmonella enterica]|nr:hypothetical protein [Salmonella enterica]MEA1704873.1 hypothetical protein [Salmonella enterica subsp. enterica serovar Minnesota]MDX9555281.1 hypothetical protein [Salmonella enterica]MDX9564505.1 hypothetical protein [Salmonella enterica]MDX9569094.1 hypothetical protein [Salmonella enterica]
MDKPAGCVSQSHQGMGWVTPTSGIERTFIYAMLELELEQAPECTFRLFCPVLLVG